MVIVGLRSKMHNKGVESLFSGQPSLWRFTAKHFAKRRFCKQIQEVTVQITYWYKDTGNHQSLSHIDQNTLPAWFWGFALVAGAI